MTDPIITPDVTPDVTPTVTPDITPPVTPDTTVYFGADGVLNEGWQRTLDEDLREDKTLNLFKNVNDLAKSYVNVRGVVGKNTIAVPSDTSTEAEWQEYHKAGGRPETVADYNLAAPEGFPEEIKAQVFPEGRIEKWQERFFKGGVSKKAADTFIAEFTQDILADYQSMQQVKELAMTDLKSGLTTDWGAAYEQNKHLGNMAITEGVNGDVEFQERLTHVELKDGSLLGNHPDFVRFTSNLGGKFAEGKPPGFGAIPTPNDYQEQIDALMADPLYTKGTQSQRMKIAEKIIAIRKLMKPEPVTT